MSSVLSLRKAISASSSGVKAASSCRHLLTSPFLGRRRWLLRAATASTTASIAVSSTSWSSRFDEQHSSINNRLLPVLLLSASSAVLLAASGATTRFDSREKECKVLTSTRMEAAAAAPPASSPQQETSKLEADKEDEVEADKTTTLLNWSGTHSVTVDNASYFEPETVQEVEAIVADCYQRGQGIRPLGSALSPNGIAFSNVGMMSLANLDKVLEVDVENRTVTMQAGARVSQVIEALRPYNLTLPNLASIAEQQMGGFVQVGAHGTGKAIAPVDHYVTKLKIVTPSQFGTMTLTRETDELLFDLAKVGLGLLGVVVEITMRCIPAHQLVEHTFVLTRNEAKKQVNDLLNKHKHMRYMWIPYTDAVVVVTNDPVGTVPNPPTGRLAAPTISEQERFQPLRDLLAELTRDTATPMTHEMMQGMGFGELRDALVACGEGPLSIAHIKRCNEAEAEFWRRSEGYQVNPSDELLQFDCGGQQWVKEVCFPTGTQKVNSGNDMDFMTRLLEGIEQDNENGIPAHSPIEQRWTASSSSLLSPASAHSAGSSPDGLHSWVGIISYLPAGDEDNASIRQQRDEITKLFTGRYCDLMQKIGKDVQATSHWAKLEQPLTTWQLVDLRLFLQERFPIQLLNGARGRLDPKNLLGNQLLNTVLGKSVPPSSPPTSH